MPMPICRSHSWGGCTHSISSAVLQSNTAMWMLQSANAGLGDRADPSQWSKIEGPVKVCLSYVSDLIIQHWYEICCQERRNILSSWSHQGTIVEFWSVKQCHVTLFADDKAVVYFMHSMLHYVWIADRLLMSVFLWAFASRRVAYEVRKLKLLF